MKIPENLLPDVTFACGPSQGHPTVRSTPISQMSFERSHRASDISAEGLYRDATANIKNFLRVPDDYTLIFFLGGATPALDAAMWNMVTDSVSGYRFGAFSSLWGKKIAAQLPGTVKTTFADLKEGEVFPSAPLDRNASFIFMTPNETATGVGIPDELLNEVYAAKGPNSIVGWDCTSVAGGRLLPADKYDVMVFSLQKCFGAPGGSAIMILSPAAVKRAEETAKARRIPYSFLLAGEKLAVDLARTKCQTVNTPSTPAIWMANEGAKLMLTAGGLEAMDKLVKRHAQVLWDWAAKCGYLKPYVADPKFRSNVTVTLTVDGSIDADAISKALKATGRPNLADGIKKYSSVKGNVIRIGCFPFIDFKGTEQFEKLTKAVDFIVKNLKTP
ncbi:MAG: aminotransferase class V-fold PLP-dependent enzyme [Planctomycetota bacterium]